MAKGYIGKILWIDLSLGRIKEETIPDQVYEQYMSGMGLGAYILYHRMAPGADPMGPDNILGFVSGLLTGTGSLFAGRWVVVGKSPLTGGWGDANCGGNFSPAIKQCGYDGIFFTGKSDRPVYLFVENGFAELRDATDLWGKDALETEEILIDTVSKKKKVRVACIGPAGEKLSLISGICNDRGRIAARSGLGAVMGAKKLKAVALGGSVPIKAWNKKKIKALSRTCNEHVQYQPKFVSGSMIAHMGKLARLFPAQVPVDGMLYKMLLKKWGTIGMNQLSVEIGDAPIKNWLGSNRDFDLDKSEPTNPDVFTKNVSAKYFCYSCPLGCGGIIGGRGKDRFTHRPEYETTLALGGLCLNESAESIFHLNDLLNRAGMDTISAGGTVAFAIECYENGLLSDKDTDGLELTWGNTKAIVALVEKMVRREGVGDLFADGVKTAAKKIGQNSIRYAVHAGGQELGMHDSRFDPGFALHNYVEPSPGKHTVGSQLYYEMFRLWKKVDGLPEPKMMYSKRSKYIPDKDKAAAGAACSKFMNVVNSAGCCLFGVFLGAHRIPIFEWLNAATGWRRSPEEYMTIGERIQTLRQLFNLKHGIDPRTYKASDRSLGRPPLSAGANKGRSVKIEKMVQNYWKALGWDTKTGKPGPESLRRLNISGES
jgi:aldehyde:ferredoxin oxidoreductase